MSRAPADIVAELAALAQRQAQLTAELAVALRDALPRELPPGAAEVPAYLTTAEAAEVLGVSERTLKTLRAEGRGPAFLRVGRSVRYPRDALRSASAPASVERRCLGSSGFSLAPPRVSPVVQLPRPVGSSRLDLATGAGLNLLLLCAACSVEQPVSGPVSVTGEWVTVEPPEPLRIAGKNEQKLCLRIATARDMNLTNGVILDDGRHQLEGEAVDANQVSYGLQVGEVGGDEVCLYRAGDLASGPDFPADQGVLLLGARRTLL